MKSKTFRWVMSAIFCSYGVLLPQLFHIFGMVSGLVFLPMHIPVLMAGLCIGPVEGLVVGIVSPIVSCLITGMPNTVNLPFMVFELAAYGLFTGMAYKLINAKKLPVRLYLSLILAQIFGRIVKALCILFAVFVLSSKAVPLASIWTSVVTGIPGIVIQLVFIPILSSAVIKFLASVKLS